VVSHIRLPSSWRSWLVAESRGSTRGMLAASVYSTSLATMFGASALYHRTRVSPRIERWLERADHAAIFIFIAGTYTPLCLLLGEPGTVLLWIIWISAALGILRALFWIGAPRFISVAQYLIAGWTVLPYVREFWALIGSGQMMLLVGGGVLYSLGAVVFARRWLDPFPEVFGFHEIFHALVVACIFHFITIASAVSRLQ
jgi:hemolysin III